AAHLERMREAVRAARFGRPAGEVPDNDLVWEPELDFAPVRFWLGAVAMLAGIGARELIVDTMRVADAGGTVPFPIRSLLFLGAAAMLFTADRLGILPPPFFRPRVGSLEWIIGGGAVLVAYLIVHRAGLV